MGAVINGQLFLTPPQKILFFSLYGSKCGKWKCSESD